MNYKVIIVIILIIVIFSFVFFKVIKRHNPKELELTYDISAGIPFKWEFEIEDESIVSFVRSYVIRDDNKGGIVGAKIYRNYVFKGLKKGTTTITFKMVSITHEETSREEKNQVIVDDDLNISLVAIPKE